ncbi:MAG TPA: T9SS type A sorting domain-containing protein [Bacteroidia bacterium]
MFKISQAQFFDSSVHYLTVQTSYGGNVNYSHNDYQILFDSVFNDTQYYHVKNAIGTDKDIKNLKTYNRKVYVKYIDEYSLLYDFSLKVGDTTKVIGFWGSLIKPNSDYILDSITRMKLGIETFNVHHVRVDGFPFQFIDSIGSIENGLFYYEYNQFESRSELVTLCKKERLIIYKDHDVVKSGKNTCHPVFYSNSIHEINRPLELQIFPNPGKANFTLKTDPAVSKDIQIWNANGQLVYSVSESTGNELDLDQLSPGIYQVLVKMQGVLLAQKLIIE